MLLSKRLAALLLVAAAMLAVSLVVPLFAAPPPTAKPSVEGVFELDKDIPAAAELWQEPVPPVLKDRWRALATQTVRFERKADQLEAKVTFGDLSWPKRTYLLTLELLDAEGRVLAVQKQPFTSSGMILTYPMWMFKTESTLSLGPWDKAQAAKRFRLTLSREVEVAGGEAGEAPADLDALVAFLKKSIGGDWRNDGGSVTARFDAADGKRRVVYEVYPLDVKAFHKRYGLGYSELIPDSERFLGSSDRFTVLQMRDFAAVPPPESEKLMTLLRLKPVDDAEADAIRNEGDAYRRLFEAYRAQIADAAKAGDKDALVKLTEKYHASGGGALLSAYVWKRMPNGNAELLLGKAFGRAFKAAAIHYARTGKFHVADCGEFVQVENDADPGSLQIRLCFKPGAAAAEPPWGETVNGLRVRLRNVRSEWKVGEIPLLKIDIESKPARMMRDFSEDEPYQLCVNRTWYKWAGVAYRWFGYSAEASGNISLRLMEGWHAIKGDTPLQLGPGTHQVQVSFTSENTRTNGYTRAESNVVEVVIALPPGGKVVPAELPWGQPVEGVQVRFIPDLTVWNSGDVPTFRIEVRNNGEREFAITRYSHNFHVFFNGVEFSGLGVWDGKLAPFGIGRQYEIPIRLDRPWSGEKQRKPELKPGKHTIYVQFSPWEENPRGLNLPPVRAMSNSVEIAILPAEAK